MTLLTSTVAKSLINSQGSSVVIPNNFTSIDKRAFLNKKLKSVTIPDSVTSIGYESFRNSGLTSAIIGNGITSIDQRAFYGNRLTSVTIPNGVTFLSGNPFDQGVNIVYRGVDNGNGIAGAITSSNAGVFQEGVTLIAGAITGDPDGNGTVTAYQWYKNNNAITGGTNSTYIVPDDGAGTYKVAITYTDGQGFIATVDSANKVVTALNNSVVSGSFTGSVTEDSNTNTATGTLSIADVDAGDSPSFADVTTTAGDNGYGSFALTNGTWTYTLDNNNATVDALDPADTLTDTFTFTATDNTTQTITVTINGAEDAPVVSGSFTGSVTEDSNTNTATGTLSIADVDAGDSPSFADVTTTAGDNGYGSFALTNGTWTYTLDNNNATVDALDPADTLTDTFTFTATDNTTQTITVTINGAEDAPVVSGSFTGSVTEDSNTNTATGTLSIADVDAGDSPSFADVTTTAGDNGYGSFALTNGTWTYTLDNNNATVDALDPADTLTDTFTFTATDNTTQTITVTINGAEDAPVVSGSFTGSVTEDSNTNTATGTLSIADVDAGDSPSFADVTTTAGDNGYGSFALTNGTWTYTLDNNNATVDALDPADTLTDTFTFTATDNTTQTITVTINGAEDAPVVSGSFTGSVTEDSDTNTATGNLSIDDVDDAEDADFVSNSSPSVATTTESTTNAEVEQPIVVMLPDGVAKPAIRVATEAIVMPEEFAEKVVDLGVQTPDYAIDFEIPLPSVFRYNPLTDSFQRTKRTKTNLPLAPLLGDLSLSDGLGRRVKSRRPVYFGIDGAGVISDLSYDPLRNAGARFYDTDGDNSADFLSLGLVDGGFGDKDGIVNGVIVDPSMPGIAELTPSITEQTNRFLKIGDPSNTTPAALAIQASLTTRSTQTTTVGYVILNEGEDPSITEDINTFKERARTLFSSLESNDVVLNDSMRFEREFLLRNGQSVRFFAITDHSLSELTSLKDARFSFLEAEVDAITGTASIGGGGGYTNSIAFSLSFLEGDQNLSALIAQEQTVAPLLDFTAFNETETITGAIVQAREAEQDAITGFYRVLDIDGSVLSADGTLLTPGDAGYAAAALRESNQIATFSNLSVADGQSTSSDFSLQDSGTFAPFAQVNGHTFFAFSEANADGLSHFRSLGTNLFGLEDQLGGGDLDFDDHIIGFNIAGLTRSDQAAVA